MAAEPVGSAYVLIRAVTTRLAKDIQEGIDKGAKDADTEASGRSLGESLGESTGESFGETWNEKAAEEIEDSGDSREVKRSQRSFVDKIMGRFRTGFDRESGDLGSTIGGRITSGIESGASDVDIGRAAGTLGEDLGDEVGDDFDVSFRRNVRKTFTSTSNDDTLKRGASGFGLRLGRLLSEGVGTSFTNGLTSLGGSIASALSAIKVPGGSFAILAQLALPALGGALQSLGALLGSTVAVLGNIGTAAAGAGVAFLGLAAALGPAFFTIKSAFSVESELLDEFNDKLEDFGEQWQTVGLATQEFLLPALGAALDVLTQLIPTFEEYGRTIGKVVGDIALSGALSLTSPENERKIDDILTQGAEVIRTIGRAGVAFLTPLLTILQAAMPIAQRFADALLGAADGFAGWVDEASSSGALTEMFDRWYDRLATIMSILGNLAHVVADVFGIGAESADGMFEALDGITERWAEWTDSEEGQSKLMTFFENAKRVSGEIFGVIGDIAERLFGPMFDTGGTEGLIGFFQTIRDVWIPTIASFVGQIKDALGPQVGDFFGALTEFLNTLSENPEITAGIFSVLISNFILFTAAIKLLNDALNTDIIKRFGPLILQILLFAKIAATLWPILALVIKGFGLLATGIGAIVAAPFALIAAAIIAIVAAITALYFHVKPFRDFVDTYIIDPIQRLWATIGGVQGIFDFFTNLWASIGGIEGIIEFFKELPRRIQTFVGALPGLITGFLENLPEMIGDIADAFVDFFLSLPEKAAPLIADFIDLIIETFQDLPSKIGEFASDFIDSATQWIKDTAPVAARELGRLIGRILRTIVELVPQLGEALFRFITELPDRIGNASGIVGPAIGRFFAALPGFFLSALDGLIDVIMSVWRNLPTLIVTALSSLGQFLLGVFEELAPEIIAWAQNTLPGVIDAIANFFTELPGRILEFLAGLPGQLLTFFEGLPEAIGSLLEVGADIASDVWDGITQFFTNTLPDIVTNFITWIGPIGEDILGFGRTLAGKIWDGISRFLTETLPRIVSQFITWVGAVGEDVIGFGRTLAGKIWDGITRYLTDILPSILTNFAAWVGNATLGVFAFGRTVAGKIWDGITRYLTDILPTLLTNFAGWIGRGFTALVAFGRTLGGQIWDGLTTYLTDILPTILTNFVSWIGSALETVVGFGRTIAGKIWDGLSETFKGYIVGLPGKMLTWIADGLDTLLTLGGQIAAKIAEGIANFFKDNPITNFVTGLFGGEGGNPFDFVLVGLQNGMQPQQFTDLLNEILHDSFSGVTISDSDAQLISDKVFQGIADGSIHNADDIQTVIENVLGEALVEGEPPASSVQGFANNVALAVGRSNWSKTGDNVKENLKGQFDRIAPKAAVDLKNSINQAVTDQPFDPSDLPLPNLSDPATVSDWAESSATNVRRQLADHLSMVKRTEFKAPADSLIQKLGEGLDKGKIGLRAFSLGLVVQIVAWISTTTRLMRTMGIEMMRALLQGLTAGLLIVRVFMLTVPNKLVTALGNVATVFMPAGVALMRGLSLGITLGLVTVISLLASIRTRAVSAVGSTGSTLASAGAQLIAGFVNGIRAGLFGLYALLSGLRNQIRSAVGPMNMVLYPAGRDLIQGMIDGIRSQIPALQAAARAARSASQSAALGGLGGNKMAMGGIVDSPMHALIGEAGREVVIPLTRPLRAMSLLHQSGLDQMVREGSPTGGDVTLLNIEHAEIHDKVDVDMVAARINSAYRAMVPMSQQGRAS